MAKNKNTKAQTFREKGDADNTKATANSCVAGAAEVAAVNEQVVGLSPAIAKASMQLTAARDNYMAGLNSVYAQQQSYITQQATTVQNVKTILSGD